MSYRYYITNLFEGIIQGTNDESVAKQFAIAGGDYFVVDTLTNQMLLEDGSTLFIRPVDYSD